MIRGLVLAFVVGFAVPSWATEITVASFNIRIFSTGSRDDSELALIADRLQQFDLIAIQELRDEEVVRRTLDILAERGLEYRALVSSRVGRGSLERYAYLWREKVVQALDAGAIFPDPHDVFSREPYVASFRAGNFDFTLITMHSIWGDSKDERRAEALMLDDVYQLVQDADSNEPRLSPCQTIVQCGLGSVPTVSTMMLLARPLQPSTFVGARSKPRLDLSRPLYCGAPLRSCE